MDTCICAYIGGVPCDTQRFNVCLNWLGRWKIANSEEFKPLEDGMFCQLRKEWTLQGNQGSSLEHNQIKVNYLAKPSPCLACLSCYLKQASALNKTLLPLLFLSKSGGLSQFRASLHSSEALWHLDKNILSLTSSFVSLTEFAECSMHIYYLLNS